MSVTLAKEEQGGLSTVPVPPPESPWPAWGELELRQSTSLYMSVDAVLAQVPHAIEGPAALCTLLPQDSACEHDFEVHRANSPGEDTINTESLLLTDPTMRDTWHQAAATGKPSGSEESGGRLWASLPWPCWEEGEA